MNAALSSKSSPMAARYKQLGHVNTTPPAEGYAHNRYARDHRDVGASPLISSEGSYPYGWRLTRRYARNMLAARTARRRGHRFFCTLVRWAEEL